MHRRSQRRNCPCLRNRVAAQRSKRQRGGSIIATTSIAGVRSEPLVGYGYVGAKAAINNIVRHAAVELAPHNVRVNAIAPGPFLANIAGGRLHREPEAARKFAAMVPLGRADCVRGIESAKGVRPLRYHRPQRRLQRQRRDSPLICDNRLIRHADS